MCCDATDVADVCFVAMLVKSSDCIGNGRDTVCVWDSLVSMMSPCQIAHLYGGMRRQEVDMGCILTYSQGCPTTSIESHSFPSAAMPCEQRSKPRLSKFI